MTENRLSAALLSLLALLTPVGALGGDHVAPEVLVRFRAGAAPALRSTLHGAAGAVAVETFASIDGLERITLGTGTSLARALETYGRDPDVLYVEPNRRLTLQAVPNDPAFVGEQLWNLDSHPIFDDADVDAPEAWDVTTGSREVVVAIVDTGLDYGHPDLAANVFRNEAECDGDGVDDDGNGWTDDCHGIDAVDGDADPMDADVHGTHVAGIIGAVGNDGVGVVGVNWRVRLLPCKVFSDDGYGSVAAAITCLDYIAALKARGVNVVAVNASWSVTDFSAALRDAIDVQRQHGILLVAAAGNYAHCGTDPFNCRLDPDNDRKPTWPASYWLPNVLAVANSLPYGWINAGSAYGRRTVHVAAPGTNILSTVPGGGYDSLTGTSMAAPHVAGLAALLEAANPARDWKAQKNLILAGAEGDMFPTAGQLVTDARLNARGAVACADQTLVSRLRPVQDTVTAVVGRPMELAVVNLRCAAPDGTVVVTPSAGAPITLRDDGADGDQEPGDAVYAGRWTPDAVGALTLAFPGDDVVAVQVLPGAYGVSVVPFAGRTIAGTPVGLLPMEPATITPPFPIRFAGGSFETLFVDERGAVQFDGGGYNHDLAVHNEPLPSPFHSTLIAPYWDQIRIQPLADVFWEVSGTAPHRELVVEWRDMTRTDVFCDLFDDFVTFQVVFFEGSSDVLFNYPDTTVGGECPALDAGASATVGIQVAPDVATVVGFNAPVLADGTSLLWTLGGSAPPQPSMIVTPASIDFGAVAVGSSAELTFVVQNGGSGTLVGQASAAAPFSVVAGGAYALPAGDSQLVTVRFAPTTAATSVGSVAFTGGGGATRALRGVGVDATTVCPPSPRTDCHAPASKATLKLSRNPLVAGRDKLTWQWMGTSAGLADFGDPRMATRYALCIYDDGLLRAAFDLAPGVLWRATASGFELRDPAGAQQGVTSLKLSSSPGAGPAKLQLKADGPNLSGWLPGMPMSQPSVQLAASDTGACWSGSGTTAPSRNTERSVTDRCGGSRNPCR